MVMVATKGKRRNKHELSWIEEGVVRVGTIVVCITVTENSICPTEDW